jgi:hypothetical protein
MTAALNDTAGIKLMWSVEDFDACESPLYDPKRGEVYVSNMGDVSVPPPHHGNGNLSRLSPEGDLVERRWVDGLHQVKNIALQGDYIFAAD